jgi:hypothetical protein
MYLLLFDRFVLHFRPRGGRRFFVTLVGTGTAIACVSRVGEMNYDKTGDNV